jgi:glycosyltransferase involved in cell wall biosynthesis
MGAGRPVVCLDLGGPALQVTDETGIKVPAISPDQAVNGLAQALSRLATDSALRVRLGSAGRQRVKDCFDWNEKGQFLAKIYELRTNNLYIRDRCDKLFAWDRRNS